MHTHKHTQVCAGIHANTTGLKRGNSEGGREEDDDKEDAGKVEYQSVSASGCC